MGLGLGLCTIEGLLEIVHQVLDIFKPELIDAASNTAARMPSRPSIRFRPRLAESCAKSGPITTPRLGDGGGPDARNCVIQALAVSLSSFHTSVQKPGGSIAVRVAVAVNKKLVACV